MAKPIPEGFHTVTPSIVVSDSTKAMAFYKKAFGAEERFAMPGPDGKIMHCELKIGDSILLVMDAMSGPPTAAWMHVYVEDADAAFARATGAGCQVTMPLADQFWGDRYGIVSDKWNNRWAIATRKAEDLSPQQRKDRAAEAMKHMPARNS
jgi:PhnB protein